MLKTFLRIKLDDVDTENVRFQQDGISSHSATFSRSGEGNALWAFDQFRRRPEVAYTLSSDLSPCDFSLERPKGKSVSTSTFIS
ncbi:hypothetical protein Trydic_g4452 [Trypoxylus dichotomus]